MASADIKHDQRSENRRKENTSNERDEPDPNEAIIIRRATWADVPLMANMAATVYFDSVLNAFLCPRRHEYPQDLVYRFHQLIRNRFINPRNLSFVAAPASRPRQPVAYAQFIRLGDDAATQRLIASRSNHDRIWLSLQSYFYSGWDQLAKYIWPDRSADPEAMRVFGVACDKDDAKYWATPEMRKRYGNRWHAQSVVVSAAFQRRGIGKSLMAEVLARAQAEGVVVGLEASDEGERMYRSLGFQLRGRFTVMLGESEGGGIMMWEPKDTEDITRV